jgi:hypothetical protein
MSPRKGKHPQDGTVYRRVICCFFILPFLCVTFAPHLSNSARVINVESSEWQRKLIKRPKHSSCIVEDMRNKMSIRLGFLSFESLGFGLLLKMAAPFSPILLTLSLLAVALLWRRSKKPHKNLPLPPGPKRWPFIGCLLEMPRAFEYETYSEWSRQYGAYSFPLYD